jgi:hypothetical protein
MFFRDLNWRKGFFRLWLFFSALWIVAMGVLGLYPATSRYIEMVKGTHELQFLRASISYAFLEVKETDSDAAKLKGNIFDEVFKKSLKKVQEAQTGVTVTFQWWEKQPPTEADLDEVFLSALYRPNTKEKTEGVTKLSDSELISLAQEKGILEDDWTPRFSIHDRSDQKLFDNEVALASRLQRLRGLKQLSESRQNSKQDFLSSLGMTVLPPVAVLILGICLMWVFSGFAPKQSR